MQEDKFYEEKSKEYKKYEFKIDSELVEGQKPEFIELVKNYADVKAKVLDLGCGSGELTQEFGELFGEVIGVDAFEEYIKTAQKENKKVNVKFLVADGKKLPFENSTFDIIISSRGPLSANEEFVTESKRVLKENGLMIEETIGEKDKLELKELLGRGQNYPINKRKIEQVTAIVAKVIFSKEFIYYKEFDVIEKVVDLLEHAPIIPNFEKNETNKLKQLEKEGKIILSYHRLWWIGKK